MDYVWHVDREVTNSQHWRYSHISVEPVKLPHSDAIYMSTDNKI